MARVSKENYYLDIAQTVTERSTCLRRVYGAIIVKNDEIISTGYNGAPRGRRNCVDLGRCTREAMRIPRGERYELCRSVHAEANAIISAARRDMAGGTLYLVGRDARTGALLGDADSCSMCRRQIINAGLERVVIRRTPEEYAIVPVRSWIDEDDSLPAATEADERPEETAAKRARIRAIQKEILPRQQELNRLMRELRAAEAEKQKGPADRAPAAEKPKLSREELKIGMVVDIDQLSGIEDTLILIGSDETGARGGEILFIGERNSDNPALVNAWHSGKVISPVYHDSFDRELRNAPWFDGYTG